MQGFYTKKSDSALYSIFFFVYGLYLGHRVQWDMTKVSIVISFVVTVVLITLLIDRVEKLSNQQ